MASHDQAAGDFCARCGQVHESADCRAALSLEPPRFCPTCGRRMVVQVTPVGWTASCSRHGAIGG